MKLLHIVNSPSFTYNDAYVSVKFACFRVKFQMCSMCCSQTETLSRSLTTNRPQWPWVWKHLSRWRFSTSCHFRRKTFRSSCCSPQKNKDGGTGSLFFKIYFYIMMCYVILDNNSKQVIWEKLTRLSLIHIWRCRRIERCRSRWSPYH